MARLLILTPQLPYPPQALSGLSQGTTIRNFNLLAGLSTRHSVDLVARDHVPQRPLDEGAHEVQVLQPGLPARNIAGQGQNMLALGHARLARAIGGSTAGSVAGLVIAVSAAAIDESTFIWNPNLIALSSAIALAGAWRAWSGGRTWWWVIATMGVAVTMQCHVLGVALLPIVGALFILDARRRPLGGVACWPTLM